MKKMNHNIGDAVIRPGGKDSMISFPYRIFCGLMMIKLVSLILIAAMLLSCSSQARRIPSPMVTEADNLFRIGKRFSSQEQYDNAIRSFELALERYSLVDHIEGMVLSRIALIGTIVRSGKDLSVDDKLEELIFFIETAAPEYKPNIILLKTELAYMAGDYETVNMLTDNFRSKDLVIESQIVSYRLMALIEQGLNQRAEYRRLRRNSRILRKSYRKRRIDEIGIYSYVNYVMGYYQLRRGRPNRAIEFFEISLTADRVVDNINGVAQNLYHIATAYERLDNAEQAKVHYRRAMKIFDSLGNKARTEQIERRLAQLQ